MKFIIITDDLHDQFKHLTCNQIKLVLIRLLNSNDYDPKRLLYHRKLDRFNKDNAKLSYLKPYIESITKIKEYRLDTSNKKEYQKNLQKLKKNLPHYYKVPLTTLDNILSQDMSKTKLLVALQILKVRRMMNYHSSYTFRIKNFLTEIYGNISRKELSVKSRELGDIACDISVTISDISVTISDISVTISDISVTNPLLTD